MMLVVLVSEIETSFHLLMNLFLFKDTFVTDMNDVSSNITFAGDYDALNASDELEIIRAMIYNYLLRIGMPLISDIVLAKGTQFHLEER